MWVRAGGHRHVEIVPQTDGSTLLFQMSLYAEALRFPLEEQVHRRVHILLVTYCVTAPFDSHCLLTHLT